MDTEITMIPVAKIFARDYSVRADVDEDGILELAASIRRVGIIVPLVVRPDGDQFQIVAGHRRYLAAFRADLKEVPAIIRTDEDNITAEVSLAENLFRQDLTPIEQAAAIKDTLDNQVMDRPELAKAMHRTELWVQAQVQMLNWPDDVLAALHQGWISVSAASNISLIEDDTYRNFLLSNARDNGATARTTAAWLQAWRSQRPAEEAIQAEPVSGTEAITPALPQAPCLVCNNVFRTDGLAMVMVCPGCIATIRGVGVQG